MGNNEGPVIAFIKDSILESIGCYLGDSYSINDTTTGSLRLDRFIGDIIFNKTTVTREIHADGGSDIIMRGSLTAQDASVTIQSSRVQRIYKVFVKSSTGELLPNLSLKLFDFNSQEIWSGITDEKGKTEFSITFDDNNYTETWTIKAPFQNVEDEVKFLTNTPLKITISDD